ncbi:hypothetical protein F5Y09DRAFT_356921 [Xylaria sp. FL1042]|nr:hypothetical protein F5Y09DRAFT_356921 [Xylaria sp. FL1042]
MTKKVGKSRESRSPSKASGSKASGMSRTSSSPPLDGCYLRNAMPTTGMKYQSDERLMHHVRRDWRVADALQSVGYSMERRHMSRAFADMFRVAGSIVSTEHKRGVDLWDILPQVQQKINWARQLPEAIFFELFTCLIEARHEWQKNTERPSRAADSDRFIHEIDAFRRHVGDGPRGASKRGEECASWILVDAVFFNEMAGGLDIDEDEDEDEGVEMKDNVDVANVADAKGQKGDKDTLNMDEIVRRITPTTKRMSIQARKRRKR